MAELVGVLDRLDVNQAERDDLILERAQAIRAAVASGLSRRSLPHAIADRLSEATIKNDLRRVPRLRPRAVMNRRDPG